MLTDRKSRVLDWSLAFLGIACLVATAAFVRHRIHVTNAPTDPFAPRVLTGVHRLASEGTVLGGSDAPIRLIEFSDFQCPFCRRLHQTLGALRARHPEVAVVYRHFPLAIHTEALPAAIAAECAGVQGRFESYAQLLFEQQDSLRDGIYDRLARQAGVSDSAQFAACRASRSPMPTISRDIEAGEQLQIVGTPVLIIGDTVLVGAAPDSVLEGRLAAALRAVHRARSPSATR